MCGIVGYVGKALALPILIEGLNNLEYRGYDSSGVGYFYNNEIIISKEIGKVAQLKKKLDLNLKTSCGIAHTRWATHGNASVNNSHPHQCGKITIVHNGIFENYQNLKLHLFDKEYHFKSDTDTEVGCALLDYHYQKHGDMLMAIQAFKTDIVGSYALGILCQDEPNRIYALRKDSPLIVGVQKDGYFLASDIHAILKYTNQYILIEEGQIVCLDNNCTVYDQNLNKVDYQINIFDQDHNSSSKNGFEHYMLKEIHEEPQVLLDTHNMLNQIDFDFNSFYQFEIVACGSSYHAGLVGKCLIETYGSKPVTVEIASEYRYQRNFGSNKLVIFISQSGETADSLACLQNLKDSGNKTLAIVNVIESSMARIADHVIYTQAGQEIAVATTKAYISQLYVMLWITAQLNKEINFDIVELINQTQQALAISVTKIAKFLQNAEHVYFLGRGIDRALAMEASLKFKEISYIHSEAYAAGELKHGTLSLIEKDTPVIGIITDPALALKTISNLKEVKARLGCVILITTEKLASLFPEADHLILVPDTKPFLSPFVTIIPLQMLSYEVAKLKGCEIDQPRNLAKSVTVE